MTASAVYLAQIECAQVMRAFVVTGSQAPLHCSGVGKALLSALPGATVVKLVRKRGLVQLTPNTITSPADAPRRTGRLPQERLRLRRRGTGDRPALRRRRHPRRGRAGPRRHLSISGPKARIDDQRLPVVGAQVKAMADRISAEMGGHAPL